MSWIRKIALLGLVLVFAVPVAVAFWHYKTRIFVFDRLNGPSALSVLPKIVPSSWRAYEEGGPERLAIFLTDEDSAWLGLVHGLKAIGVPFIVTRDIRQAARHKVVMVYPMISGRILSPEILDGLRRMPEAGKALIGVNVLGGGLNEVFGFTEAVEGRGRFEMKLDEGFARETGFTEPEEQSFRLGDPKLGAAQLGTTGYAGAAGTLASFDDGKSAITRRRIGAGAAYAFGFDPGSVLLTGQNARGEDLERDYVNTYAPFGDVVLKTLRAIWRAHEPLAVTLGRVPDGKALAVLLTHDIDYTKSLANAVDYAELEQREGVRATYFMQTKYVRDFNDEIMLNDESVRHLRRLSELGMELASHSVAHARAFRTFEMGDGREAYPVYTPFVTARDEASGGTILGELRISKFLIESLVQGTDIVSFRPGHLSNPPLLPEAMEAAGYRYSSTITAGNALSHLPFRLNYSRGASAESPIYEFPLTVEDERLPLMGLRLKESLALASKIARDGGIFNILIHPNILGHKYAFAEGIIKALKPTAWFGTLRDFAEWWTGRDQVRLDAVKNGTKIVVTATALQAVRGLTIEVPKGWVWRGVKPAAVKVDAVPNGVLIDRVQGRVELEFEPDLKR